MLAHEWPDGGAWLHAHFIHTPASVARYASIMTGVPWTCSAHAKDIWTSPDWELSEKLGHARWTVTCTRNGFDHMRELTEAREQVHLSYHGLDLARFGPFEGRHSDRDGPTQPILCAYSASGAPWRRRATTCCFRALALLPADLHWRFQHIGGGDRVAEAEGACGKARHRRAHRLEGCDGAGRGAAALPPGRRVSRLPAGLPQTATATACRTFWSRRRASVWSASPPPSPACRNCWSTGKMASSSPPEDPAALARALETAIRDPALRRRLGDAAEAACARAVRPQCQHPHSDAAFRRGMARRSA